MCPPFLASPKGHVSVSHCLVSSLRQAITCVTMSLYNNVTSWKIIRSLFWLNQVCFHYYSAVKHVVTIALSWYPAPGSVFSLCIMCVALPQFYLLYECKPLTNLQTAAFPCRDTKIKTTVASMPHPSLLSVTATRYWILGSSLPGKTSTPGLPLPAVPCLMEILFHNGSSP